MSDGFEVVPAGDTALFVEFANQLDAGINRRVVALWRRLQALNIPGVLDLVPAYRTLAVYFDPLRTDVGSLAALLAATAASTVVEHEAPGDVIRIPVCYGGEYGPDLEEVASMAGRTPDEVVALHAAPVYRVFMLGFSPGFAYMGAVDERIAAPRRSTPRLKVAAGSVGLAGRQTGIYPSETPGGWMLIGRTPLRPFVADRPEVFLFKAGDLVRFEVIDEAGYALATAETVGR